MLSFLIKVLFLPTLFSWALGWDWRAFVVALAFVLIYKFMSWCFHRKYDC